MTQLHEKLRHWAGRSWWRWFVIALPWLLLVVVVALRMRGQQKPEEDAQPEVEAAKTIVQAEARRQQAQHHAMQEADATIKQAQQRATKTQRQAETLKDQSEADVGEALDQELDRW